MILYLPQLVSFPRALSLDQYNLSFAYDGFEFQISIISKIPLCPNVHDVHDVVPLVTCCPTCQMWSHFVTSGYTCHMWSHLPHIVTCGHTCHLSSPNLPSFLSSDIGYPPCVLMEKIKYIIIPLYKDKKIKRAIARVIFFSLIISEDYDLAHSNKLQETKKTKQQKKRTGMSWLII